MIEHYLDRLARTINENWDQPALTDFYLTEDGSTQDTSRGKHYTYGEMYSEILRLDELFAALGLQKGDHIAICAANSAHWVIAYLAIAACQGVSVTILHTQNIEDIAHQIDYSDAKALFTDIDIWNELKMHVLPQVNHVIGLDNWQILRGVETKSSIFNLQSSIRQAHFIHGNPDELAMICFTSGSTNASKGVMISNRNISNNALNAIQAFPESENRNFVCCLPLSHMYGLMIELIGQIVRGRHIFVYRDVLNIDNLWEFIACVRPCGMAIIPYFIIHLYNKYRQDIISQWTDFFAQIHIGGSLADNRIVEDLRANHIPLSVGYGTTETAPLISDSQSPVYRLFSSGKIVEGMTARIADNGEILVKGENVMLGYYKNPEATAQKIDSDGWLHTGDRGHLDEDGYLYVEGRLEQDMIVLPNGENIRPEDIERKINALPEVKESIVLARGGKLVAIVVTDADIRRHILRTINPELPLYSQLYDVEITDIPLQKTEKQTIKRYLYK